MSKRVEFWAMWGSGPYMSICEKAKTHAAVLREARKCERMGGAKHEIVRVEYLKRTDAPVKVRGER